MVKISKHRKPNFSRFFFPVSIDLNLLRNDWFIAANPISWIEMSFTEWSFFRIHRAQHQT